MDWISKEFVLEEPLSETEFRESHLKSLLGDVVREIVDANEVWIETEVNLWKLRESRKWIPTDYLHPFEPDIDILCGPVVNGERSNPINAVELKLFTHKEGRYPVIPKTRTGEGFYAGIGQALALLLNGVDYSWLWQVFLVPYKRWDSLSETEEQFDHLLNQHVEWYSAYKGVMEGLLGVLSLPIGYRTFALFLPDEDAGKGFLMYQPQKSRAAPRNPIYGNRTPSGIRELLCKRFGIAAQLG